VSHEPFDIEREPGSQDLRARLVEELRAGDSIRTIGVATAFAEVPRELFIPEVAAERGLEAVYRDEAYVTKQDARGTPLSSSSQPAMMAQMLELLDVAPGHRILEIGAGTGYNAALLSQLVGPSGHVTTIDVDPAIAASAERALRDAAAPVEVAVGDGRVGLAAGAPYDRIIVTASAESIPAAWFSQLADGGRLVVPLRLDPDADALQLIPAFVRSGSVLTASETTWGGFMPLHAGDGTSQAPQTSLQATLSSGARPSLLVSLTGSGLEGLSEGAAKRLMSALLGDAPRTGAHGTTRLVSGHTPAVLIYLMARIPRRRRIWMRHADRHGVGLLDARGRGIAAVTVPSLWSRAPSGGRRTRWRVEGWGDERAAAELARLVADWQTLHRERRDRLEITARPADETAQLRFSWVDRPRR
jgi:protein-L-isoaspartate(D-aspartate) O-methyltransferase